MESESIEEIISEANAMHAELERLREWVNGLMLAHWGGQGILTLTLDGYGIRDNGQEWHGKTPLEAINSYLEITNDKT